MQKFLDIPAVLTSDNFVLDENKHFYCFRKNAKTSCLNENKGRTRSEGGPKFSEEFVKEADAFFEIYNQELFAFLGVKLLQGWWPFSKLNSTLKNGRLCCYWNCYCIYSWFFLKYSKLIRKLSHWSFDWSSLMNKTFVLSIIVEHIPNKLAYECPSVFIGAPSCSNYKAVAYHENTVL